MEDYQERMLNELNELSEKICKLENFTKTETFRNLDEHRRTLLVLQNNAMAQYALILACRCTAEGIDKENILAI